MAWCNPLVTERTARQVSGFEAETAALEHLQQAGLQLLARNVGYSVGELDLILRDADTLVFVEVRQRKSEAFGGAAASLDRRKQRKCALAAQCWLKQNPAYARWPCRFDAVLFSGVAPHWQMQWLKNAFVFQDVF